MSTKIYDAWFSRQSIAETYRRVVKLRGHLRDYARRVLTAEIEHSREEFGSVDWAERIEESMASGLRSDPLNLSCSAVIYPLPPGWFRSEGCLVQFFGFERWQGCIFAERMDQSFLREFHFQNSSDRPETIGAGEWKRRKRIWGEVFAATHRPCDAGMTVELIDAHWAAGAVWRILGGVAERKRQRGVVI